MTWSGEPALQPDDRLAADACGARGAVVEATPWDAPCDWRAYDAIVLRSTWNYHRQPDAFLRWLHEVEAACAPLWNPPAVVRWNMDKRYLLQLVGAGVLLPDTIVVPAGGSLSLADALRDRRWEAAVVKPAISANAFHTERVTLADAGGRQAWFDRAVVDRDMLVQRFVPDIADGELSLIFFRGCFSHAVRKIAARGEFRVQEHHGGVVRPYRPDRQTIETCERCLTHLPGPTLYARVDGIATRAGFVLFEIEAIEPSLFFSHDPAAAGRFAAAL